MKKSLIIFKYVFVSVLISYSCPVCAETPAWLKQAADEAEKDGYALITPDELKVLYDSGRDFLIVDVRPDYEYKAGHLPDAVQIEFDLGERSNLNPVKRQQFEDILGPDKGREIIIYCRNYQ